MKIRTMVGASVGILGGILAAVFAGPGPQYWQQMERIREENAARQKASPSPATAGCVGCKSTPIWGPGDRSPGGKGPLYRVVGNKHECTGCVGVIVVKDGKVSNAMTHGPKCGPLQCCR